ncbi:MAG TPA: bacteriohemerythrin [Gallionellaceae bacterium]
MAYMQWTEDLETGIQVIDDQHKRIIGYINELHHASETGSAAEVKEVLEGLLDYTVTHFQFEEELQAKAGYPFLKAHQRVHEIFMKRIATFRERANKGENIIPELLSMLKVWLSSHIKGDDRDYVESVKKITGSDEKENAGWLSTTLKRFFG